MELDKYWSWSETGPWSDLLKQAIDSVAALTEYGRERLSKNFFMREMLYSEVGNLHGVPNIPEDPELALHAGRQLATQVLEPLLEAFGHITIRSAYRSPTLNAFCHELFLGGDATSWCDCNEGAAAHHIWDRRDAEGHLGATATLVIPSYIDHYERTGDYRPLGWWIRDNLPGSPEVLFFRRLGAFNIRWYEGPSTGAIAYSDPPQREQLTARGEPGFEGDHSPSYAAVLSSILKR